MGQNTAPADEYTRAYNRATAAMRTIGSGHAHFALGWIAAEVRDTAASPDSQLASIRAVVDAVEAMRAGVAS